MAEIRPFCGTRYNLSKAGDVASLIAPPYDVVTREKRDFLVQRNPYNIFSLELPQAQACNLEESMRFECARRLLHEWLKKGTLVQDENQAFYPYEITFSHKGRLLCRKGFIGLLKVEDWGKRIVLPHEQTFNKVTEERLKLTRTTRAQFSQIFALFRHNKKAMESLEQSKKEELLVVEDEFGNHHRLFRIVEQDALSATQEALKNTPVYIADGHHRYTTALKYSKEPGGYGYIMTYFVDSGDPGLVVLPTHRIVHFPTTKERKELIKKASLFFDIEEMGGQEGLTHLITDKIAAEKARKGIGVIYGKDRKAEIWWTNGGSKAALSQLKDLPPELSRLDVVLLNEVVFKDVFGLNKDFFESPGAIKYTPDEEKAFRELEDSQILFLLSPTPVEQVLDIADAGLTMPHKSTFFYPKILTGMVMNVMEP